ncbi:MAG: GAF domain-containing protein [Acidimicrobiales bacterium]
MANPRPSGTGTPDRSVDRLSAALDSPLKLRGALQLTAQRVVDEVGCTHCSIYLLDGRELHPAVAVAKRPSASFTAAFRSVGTIDVDPDRWALFPADHTIVIDDVRASKFIPRAWIDRFSVHSIVLVSLGPSGEPAGVLAAAWKDVHQSGPEELELLRTLGSYAALAIGYARPFQRVSRQAQLQEALVRAAGALAAPLEPDEIVRQVVDAYSDLLDARCCAAALVDLERGLVTTVASRNTGELREQIPLAEVPERIFSRLSTGWAEGNHLIELDDDPWLAELLDGREHKVSRYVLLPLSSNGKPCGGVLLGFGEHTRLDAEERGAALALAAHAAAALERRRLLNDLADRVRRLDLLHHVSAAFIEDSDAESLVSTLKRLLAPEGIDVAGVTFRARRLLDHLGGDAATSNERKAWRRDARPIELPDGSLSVPMRLGRQIGGALRVRPVGMGSDDVALVEALGAGLLEVANRGVQRAAVEEAARERAQLAERDRFRLDLHDTAGQLFVGIGLLTTRLFETLPADSEWANQAARIVALSAQGKDEIDQAIGALTFVPATPGGLACSLRALTERFADDSGLRIGFAITGRPVRLAADVEQAIYRLANEALANAWRHAQCLVVDVNLVVGPEEVTLRVSDDGVGFADPGIDTPKRTGVSSMRRTMEKVGGSLQLTNGIPAGAVVEAKVPRRPRSAG